MYFYLVIVPVVSTSILNSLVAFLFLKCITSFLCPRNLSYFHSMNPHWFLFLKIVIVILFKMFDFYCHYWSFAKWIQWPRNWKALKNTNILKLDSARFYKSVICYYVTPEATHCYEREIGKNWQIICAKIPNFIHDNDKETSS